MLLCLQVDVEYEDERGDVISEARPGQNINVRVNTEADSLVGLLSVDQSILLLGGRGHDITQSQVHTNTTVTKTLLFISNACNS